MTSQTIQIEASDALKIHDALESASIYFLKRDEMNASIHLADPVRYSPITSKVAAGLDRLIGILDAAGILEESEPPDRSD